MKRVKGVEDLNVRAVRAQGIVGVGVITRICIVLFQAVGLHLMARVGSLAGRDSFSRSRCCRAYFGDCFYSTWTRHSSLAS